MRTHLKPVQCVFGSYVSNVLLQKKIYSTKKYTVLKKKEKDHMKRRETFF